MAGRTALKSAARPAVLVAAAHIYLKKGNEANGKIAECEQALARDNFQVFAGCRGATTFAHGVGLAFLIQNYLHECLEHFKIQASA